MTTHLVVGRHLKVGLEGLEQGVQRVGRERHLEARVRDGRAHHQLQRRVAAEGVELCQEHVRALHQAEPRGVQLGDDPNGALHEYNKESAQLQ